MPFFLCTTCGTQFPESDAAPEACPICQDERQYVPPEGQRWTTLEELRASHRVEELGGIAAISISHPHYYSSMVEWAEAFDAPIYLHAADREWVMRPSDRVVFWEEERRELGPGLTLVRCGGHYEGGTVLHWAAGAEGRGALLSGDIVQVIPDRHYVSFMYSYPNLIPLNEQAIRRIVAALEPFDFDRIHGAWWDRVVPTEAKAVVVRSAERYLKAIGG
jgi:glyoxylase-like metal-dependent hydrolase (beta-lactamase superfamily II)